MSVLLYGSGLIIGITLFLYILSTIETGKEKLAGLTSGEKALPPEKVSNPKGPFTRTCPLCGSELKKTEPLYATWKEIAQETRVAIHGCRYCYREEPGKEKED